MRAVIVKVRMTDGEVAGLDELAAASATPADVSTSERWRKDIMAGRERAAAPTPPTRSTCLRRKARPAGVGVAQ